MTEPTPFSPPSFPAPFSPQPVQHFAGSPGGSLPPPRPPKPPTQSTGARLAWLIPGGILAVAAIGFGTYNVLELLAHEVHTERTEFDAADIASLDVSASNGSITIVGDDGAETVGVVARISDGWVATDVDVAIVGDVLEARSSCPVMSTWCSTDFTITVPADMPVRVDGSDGGVRASGLHGAIDLDTDNGRVEMTDVSGSIRVTNDNGSIVGTGLGVSSVDVATDNGRIELPFVEPPDEVRGRSHNGRVEVTVPDHDVAYRVLLDTDNGSTEIGVRTDPASEHTIDLATSNGSVRVFSAG